MLKFSQIALVAMILFFSDGHASGWEKIEVPNTPSTILDDNGQYKDIKPGCAFSYLPDEAGLPNKPFHFYYRKGIKPQTLIFFNCCCAC